jgi:hypothetical protein
MSRNGIRQQEVRSSDAPPTPRRRPRYRLPKTSDDDWPTTVAGDLLRERFEARAKKEQQDFVNAFKRVDERRAAMANTAIRGEASEEQMKALEDALRGDGDKSIKAPWDIDGYPPFKCPGNKSKGCNCKKGGVSGESSLISCQLFRCASLSLLRGCIFLSVARARSLSLCLQRTGKQQGGRPTKSSTSTCLVSTRKWRSRLRAPRRRRRRRPPPRVAAAQRSLPQHQRSPPEVCQGQARRSPALR